MKALINAINVLDVPENMRCPDRVEAIINIPSTNKTNLKKGVKRLALKALQNNSAKNP